MNKTLLTYILLIGIAGTAGVATGAILKRTVGPIDEIYPKGFSPDEYKDSLLMSTRKTSTAYINATLKKLAKAEMSSTHSNLPN